ncbi:nickel-dependent hydrogenase large subunit [Hydrogenimonas sp.]|uniref:hydrogenase large subunit n=1 Tax=Hydrogenimonas sp. TaxID=2231112 RepID=UPI00261329C6|nr:nickel-dependent hydrogenase large subunit [Hydrogenimonas sp.]
MKKVINIPLGSQHISLLEPVRFQFKTHNEKIVEVGADVGFVHRGIERACVTQFEWKKLPYVVARVCGLCAITHSLSFTLAVEKMLEFESTRRIDYLRMLMVELDRIHSHMLCLSHTAENAGFEAMFMEVMAAREPVMDLQEAISGNRVQFDYIAIGGVHRDISPETAKEVVATLDALKPKIERLLEEFSKNWSLSLKYRGVGMLTYEEACIYNTLGPLARAAGLRTDVRLESSDLPYEEVGFEVVLEKGGDIHARNMVRLYEILNSIEMCKNIVQNLPEGEHLLKIKGKPKGEAIVRLEAPRGELMYLVRGSGKNFLDRVRIKTPTFSGIPAMVEIFKGSEYADAPAILASFDPCMSCTAK